MSALAIALLLLLSVLVMARPAEAHSNYCGHVQDYNIFTFEWNIYNSGHWVVRNGAWLHHHHLAHYYHSMTSPPQTWYQHSYSIYCTR